LRLFTSWKSSIWVVDSLRFCSQHHFILSVHSPSGRPSVHSVIAYIIFFIIIIIYLTAIGF
jgi:hypothetical protein